MTDYQQACETMIHQQLRTNGVSNAIILDLIKSTPRECFVPNTYRDFAYADLAIPLMHNQQMWLPEIEAQVLQALNIQPNDHVLEVGTGTGYFTALLAQLATTVTTVDLFEDFVQTAKKNPWFKKWQPIEWLCENFAEGPTDRKQMYDVIVITGALPSLPPRFMDALHHGGRLIALLGQGPAIEVVLFTTDHDGHVTQRRLTETWTPSLIPLTPSNHFTF